MLTNHINYYQRFSSAEGERKSVLSNVISFFRSYLITANNHAKYVLYTKLSDYKSKTRGAAKLTYIKNVGIHLANIYLALFH